MSKLKGTDLEFPIKVFKVPNSTPNRNIKKTLITPPTFPGYKGIIEKCYLRVWILIFLITLGKCSVGGSGGEPLCYKIGQSIIYTEPRFQAQIPETGSY